jgi:ABC-type hemin transport system ATPase subunit
VKHARLDSSAYGTHSVRRTKAAQISTVFYSTEEAQAFADRVAGRLSGAPRQRQTADRALAQQSGLAGKE